MRFLTIVLLVSAIMFTACGEKKTVTPNGYSYTRHKKGNGKMPAEGDYAFVHVYVNMDGKMVNSTRQQNQMMPIRIPPKEELTKMKESGKPNPIIDAACVMSPGDSVSVVVPITEDMRKNPQMANAKEMIYDIVLVETKTEDEFKAYQEAEKQKQMELMMQSQAKEEEIGNQVKQIAADYTSGKLNDKIKTTASGLKYMVLKEGNGPATKQGQPVNVHYYGALTNGEMFDNSFKRGRPFSFPLGQGRVIKGWDEGLALLKGGDHAVLFIPSEMGYGKAGSPPKIPGDSELIFYIEVQ